MCTHVSRRDSLTRSGDAMYVGHTGKLYPSGGKSCSGCQGALAPTPGGAADGERGFFHVFPPRRAVVAATSGHVHVLARRFPPSRPVLNAIRRRSEKGCASPSLFPPGLTRLRRYHGAVSRFEVAVICYFSERPRLAPLIEGFASTSDLISACAKPLSIKPRQPLPAKYRRANDGDNPSLI